MKGYSYHMIAQAQAYTNMKFSIKKVTEKISALSKYRRSNKLKKFSTCITIFLNIGMLHSPQLTNRLRCTGRHPKVYPHMTTYTFEFRSDVIHNILTAPSIGLMHTFCMWSQPSIDGQCIIF